MNEHKKALVCKLGSQAIVRGRGVGKRLTGLVDVDMIRLLDTFNM